MSVDKLQGILHNQMIFEMKNDIFWITISILIILIGYFKIIKYYNFLKQFEQYKDDHKEFWFSVIWGILMFIAVLIVGFGTYDLIQMYINPEYYMIQLLLKK